jgi:hypothetical protein
MAVDIAIARVHGRTEREAIEFSQFRFAFLACRVANSISQLSHSISAILRLSGDHVACVSQECDVTVIGEDLQPLSHWKPAEEQRLIKAFAYPKANCALAPNSSSKPGAFVFMFSQYASKKVRVHLLSVSQVGKTSVVNSRDCPVQNPEVRPSLS